MNIRFILSVLRGSSRLLLSTIFVLRDSKRKVKKASKKFYEGLLQEGIPVPVAKVIAKEFESSGKEILTIRKILSSVGRLN